MALHGTLTGTASSQKNDVSVITSLQQLDKLQQESEWLKHLLAVLPAGVVVLDANGRVSHSNGVAQQLLEDSLNDRLWREIIVSAFKPRKDDGHEVSLVNGKRVKLSITPLETQPGQLILITDLTETRQLQERSNHLQRLSMLGKMVASLAHQIRTPLSAATLYAANLKNPTLSQNARDTFVDKLMSRIKDLEGQVSDMLLFAKSDQQIVSEITVCELMDEVRKATEAQIQSYHATLVIDIPESNISFLGNLPALSGVIQNLITNSLQVRPVDPVIKISTTSIDKGKLQISVEDNGPGMAQQDINKIFEPFYTTKTQGTGLGLAVAKTVIHSHKGRIEVNSEQGKGATFKLILPKSLSSDVTKMGHPHIVSHDNTGGESV